MEDDVDVWCYTILELHARNDDDTVGQMVAVICPVVISRKLIVIDPLLNVTLNDDNI